MLYSACNANFRGLEEEENGLSPSLLQRLVGEF